MTKEEIALIETNGIFDDHELGITGLANAMEVYAEQQCIEFLKWSISRTGIEISLRVDNISQLYNLFLEHQLKKGGK